MDAGKWWAPAPPSALHDDDNEAAVWWSYLQSSEIWVGSEPRSCGLCGPIVNTAADLLFLLHLRFDDLCLYSLSYSISTNKRGVKLKMQCFSDGSSYLLGYVAILGWVDGCHGERWNCWLQDLYMDFTAVGCWFVYLLPFYCIFRRKAFCFRVQSFGNKCLSHCIKPDSSCFLSLQTWLSSTHCMWCWYAHTRSLQECSVYSKLDKEGEIHVTHAH